MPTHKKAHDKDKYYYLAKDQGYRSRAAFKIIQINKRFNILNNARVCIDLCAAPGGWCQVAAKTMPPGSIVLGVDLLPIRAIRNVKTIVSDITTAECRRLIATELQGWKADVVLCDGAPNIGSAYSKDAYVQNELVLAALRTATDHLVEKGTFCSKIYRSDDYNALIWVFNQLFEEVQVMKPASSRSQSAEIFCICTGYYAPKTIDPKLLDPNHVFKEVSGATSTVKNADGTITTTTSSSGGSGSGTVATIDVLHKKYEKHNRRHRTGYDTEALGPLLTRTLSVADFVRSQDPVRRLTDNHQIVFKEGCPECDRFKARKQTTEEVILQMSDLRLCGKIDFKKILRWRQVMRKMDDAEKAEVEAQQAAAEAEANGGADRAVVEVVQETEEQRENRIQDEIDELRAKAAAKERKEKKKSREQLAKARQRTALGMGYNSFAAEGDAEGELFSLANTAPTLHEVNVLMKSGGRRERGEGDSDSEEGEDDADVDLFNSDNDDDDEGEDADLADANPDGLVYGSKGEIFMPSATLESLEDELDEDYGRYMTKKQSKYHMKKQLEREKERKKNKGKADAAELEEKEELRKLEALAVGGVGLDEDPELMGTLASKRKRMAGTAEALTKKRTAEDAEMFEDEGSDGDEDDVDSEGGSESDGSDMEEEDEEGVAGGLLSKKAMKDLEKFNRRLGEDDDEESDDEDSEDDDEEEEDEVEAPMVAAKGKGKAAAAAVDSKRRLVSGDKSSTTLTAKAEKWFANPIFQQIGGDTTAPAAPTAASKAAKGSKKQKMDEGDDEDDAYADADMVVPASTEVVAKATAPKETKASKAATAAVKRQQQALQKKKALEAFDSDDDEPITAEQMLEQMGNQRTDKQLRHEKRMKELERKTRKEEKRGAAKKRLVEDEENDVVLSKGLQVVPSDGGMGMMDIAKKAAGAGSAANGEDDDLMTAANWKDVKEKRDLIKAGLGRAGSRGDENAPLQIVGADGKIVRKGGRGDEESDDDSAADSGLRKRKYARGGGDIATDSETDSDDEEEDARVQAELMRRKDTRSYDSDEEDYDQHDRAVHLALGTMMLNKTRAKAMMDASYNRYAFNDDKDLPSWFLDDELKHNKPQIPVPPALLNQIKGRNTTVTGQKEIKKVAEARMRKRKKAMLKLKSARKNANALVDNTELSEKQKLKAIQKTMKAGKIDKPNKVYVVTGRTAQGSMGTVMGGGKAKGKLKFVDKRAKKDRRAEKRNEKKSKGKKRR